tara:strand:- start:240 stop:515 length:276 start_codon:yes stop_codon:yes gene_type:complete
MCIFRGPTIQPVEVAKGPPPIRPTNPQTESKLPAKKDLVDPDEKAGVEYGAKGKLAQNQQKAGIGANALKIKVKDTNVQSAANTGGVNTSA